MAAFALTQSMFHDNVEAWNGFRDRVSSLRERAARAAASAKETLRDAGVALNSSPAVQAAAKGLSTLAGREMSDTLHRRVEPQQQDAGKGVAIGDAERRAALGMGVQMQVAEKRGFWSRFTSGSALATYDRNAGRVELAPADRWTQSDGRNAQVAMTHAARHQLGQAAAFGPAALVEGFDAKAAQQQRVADMKRAGITDPRRADEVAAGLTAMRLDHADGQPVSPMARRVLASGDGAAPMEWYRDESARRAAFVQVAQEAGKRIEAGSDRTPLAEVLAVAQERASRPDATKADQAVFREAAAAALQDRATLECLRNDRDPRYQDLIQHAAAEQHGHGVSGGHDHDPNFGASLREAEARSQQRADRKTAAALGQ
jgi:hypothetical protein